MHLKNAQDVQAVAKVFLLRKTGHSRLQQTLTEQSATMNKMRAYAIENHPNDSRATIDRNGIVQTLSSRMGTGGNNTPFVLITSTKADTQNGNLTVLRPSESPAEAAETEVKELFVPVCVMATSHWNAPFTDGDVSPTLCARAGTGGNQLPLVALKRMDE